MPIASVSSADRHAGTSDQRLFMAPLAAQEEGEPLPCGASDPRDTRRFCQREDGHAGRHKYRRLNGLVN